MSRNHSNTGEEGITLFGHKPAEVLEAFYASGLSARGFSIVGRIVPQRASIIGRDGENDNLFNGEMLYAGTFIRSASQA